MSRDYEVAPAVELIERLTAIACTRDDIAWILGWSTSTLDRRLTEPEYRAAFDRGLEAERPSLKRFYWNACKGAAAPLIFWAKQHPDKGGFGWRDEQTLSLKDMKPVMAKLRAMSDEELEALIMAPDDDKGEGGKH